MDIFDCTVPSPLVEREMEGEVQKKNLEELMFGHVQLYRSFSTCGEGDGG